LFGVPLVRPPNFLPVVFILY